MAARETGAGAVESYLHQGKLLALDLLVRVLTNPMHDWTHVRPEFAGVHGGGGGMWCVAGGWAGWRGTRRSRARTLPLWQLHPRPLPRTPLLQPSCASRCAWCCCATARRRTRLR